MRTFVSCNNVDDMILFMEHDLDKVRNLKLMISAFKQMLGLKINFCKVKISISKMPKGGYAI